MKKLSIYFILLLLFGFSTSFAQEVKSASSDREDGILLSDDRYMSTEEKAALLAAGDNNPSKISESLEKDPKMSDEEWARLQSAGDDNPWKIDESTQVNPRMEAERAQAESKPAIDQQVITGSGETQPEGENMGTPVNFRYLQQTGGNEQPQGEIPVHIENYRDMNGSNEQPVGDAPGK